MKKYFVILCFIVARLSAQDGEVYLFSYFIDNGQDGLHLAYSRDGYQWTALRNGQSFLKPTAGKDKLMRDPCIIKGPDGLFHMVWTVSWNEKGIGYASSKDLVHWSPQRYIPLMEHENALNCWAPEINYDAKSKRYMIYWATTIPGRFPGTDVSGDGRYNHRMYYAFTKDFKAFSKPALLYNKGFTVIDATIRENNGQYIMFLKDETKLPAPQKNIRMATSRYIYKDYSAPSMPITGNYWAEGPSVLQKGKTWIVYFDKYRDQRYGAVQSVDLKNWEDISARIIMPPGLKHGTVFTITEKEFETFFK
ncbi:glycoside hydrolase family 43 protein [Niabella drilacis]|uniref:Glycosyl hydrolases family 43 n=1 Tax=Niabella drilacis (strain DSM 25811 / CCM 8410 / CCUG 62505 / LMG 26954 / E90) TaxID=1285928 RepID=A0A1G6IXT1_NIADE|nr:glycoside hydrolase family 43 protein [Niabella drilacis]SDC10586.1 Glycosyl hydrolases family 43 [Niabella drilacis]